MTVTRRTLAKSACILAVTATLAGCDMAPHYAQEQMNQERLDHEAVESTLQEP